jgi:hypothetical protein
MSFGLAPFGLSPWAAYYAAASADTDGITAATVRNVEGGDYVQGDDGNLEQALDYVDQEVRWRLHTELGSFPGDILAGNSSVRVLVFNDSSQVALENAVSLALQPMLDRQVITKLTIKASPYIKNGTAVAEYSVTYTKTGLIER